MNIKTKWAIASLSCILVFVVAFLLIPPSIHIEASRGVMSLSVGLNTTPAVSYTPGQEVIEKRSEHSKTTYIGDNKYSVSASIGPVHYKDSDTWQAIDNSFTPAVPPWDWQMVNDSYQTFVLNDFTAGQVIKYQANGESVAFQPMALEWANDLGQIEQISMPQDVAPAVSNPIYDILPDSTNSIGTIKWYDAYGDGINFLWRNTPGNLGKLLEVTDSSDLPSPPSYIVNGGNPALRLNFIFTPSKDMDIYVDGVLWDQKSNNPQETVSPIVFRSGSDLLWNFMPARCWDSSEIEIDNIYPVVTTRLRKVAISLYISVLVPYSWLQTAVYPVYIDPTINNQAVTASTDDAFQYGDDGSDGTMFVTDVNLQLYADTSAFERRWGGARWEIAIDQGVTIDTCKINLWIVTDGLDDANMDIYFEDGASPASFSTDDGDIESRTPVATSLPWVADSVAAGGAGWYYTPELKTSLDDVTDAYTTTYLVAVLKCKMDTAKLLLSHQYDNDSDGLGVHAPQIYIEYREESISNTPESENLGVAEYNGTLYAAGSAPNNPVEIGDCTFMIINDGAATSNITASMTDMTGNVTWTCVTGSPGASQFRMTMYYAGQNPADGVVLTNASQPFYNGLAASANISWDFKYETGTWTNSDVAVRTGNLTLTAVEP